jgi:hypothetical protein
MQPVRLAKQSSAAGCVSHPASLEIIGIDVTTLVGDRLPPDQLMCRFHTPTNHSGLFPSN